MDVKTKYNVAIVGATGAVGQKIIELLEVEKFPVDTLKLLSSERSAGKKVLFRNTELVVERATPESFNNVDIALFSAGGSVSKQFAHEAVKRGAVVVDNTSAFRMDPSVPLVVPEVNESDLKWHNGIIANPNCSTIQLVAALKPLQQKFGVKRVIVSTYQSVSGAGTSAVQELEDQSKAVLEGKETTPEILPVKNGAKHYPIAFNALPQIDVFQDNGFTFEEMKMINESKKILHDLDLSVAATCVRLPFFTSHAESVYIETEGTNVTVDDVQKTFQHAEGVVLEDDPATQTYPTPVSAVNKKEVFIGRVRKDLDVPTGFHFWIVSDNLLKGAAWNSIQIAQRLIENKWL
ncbi:aspartate-semialdehyde dehydrogenase [Virgibacillus necropolis]|uniref:aspartate-semialdehyde dehydrogenase n=1 Tax=Virgibacillus necropolis TaxID=163877 RepID=UPI00384D806C